MLDNDWPTVESLNVTDAQGPAISATTPSATELYVAENLGGTLDGRAQIVLSAVIGPDVAEARALIRWQIDGNGVEGSAFGNLSSNPTVTLAPNASGNRDFVVRAGCDRNADGDLNDANETQRQLTVHVYKITAFFATDADHPENSTANSLLTPPRLYVGTGGDAVDVAFSVQIVNPMSPLRPEIVWARGPVGTAGAATPFATSSEVTIDASEAGTPILFWAGLDRNGNGTMESTERMRTVEVFVIRLDSLTVRDNGSPTVTATNPTEADLYVAEPPDGTLAGKVDVLLDVGSMPDNNQTGAYVKWAVDGDGVEGTNAGDFYQGNPTVRLAPNASGNRAFVTRVGFDSDLDGTLEASETLRQITVRVLKADLTFINAGSIPAVAEYDKRTAAVAANSGSDLLGPQAMGEGRGDYPGKAYTTTTVAKGTLYGLGPSAPSFRWTRYITRRSWLIHFDGTEWDVTLRSSRGTATPDDDSSQAAFVDVTPSGTDSIYDFDNSALLPTTLVAPATGDFIREEKQFYYAVEVQLGGVWIPIGKMNTAQVLEVRRTDVTGTVSLDFAGLTNQHSIGTVDSLISESEVRSLVGGSHLINITTGANS